MVNFQEITSLRQSFVIEWKDSITPMMVILFRRFSPPVWKSSEEERLTSEHQFDGPATHSSSD